MIFKVKADAEIDARNLDDAFEQLRDHFEMLLQGKESRVIVGGSIEIMPILPPRNPSVVEKSK